MKVAARYGGFARKDARENVTRRIYSAIKGHFQAKLDIEEAPPNDKLKEYSRFYNKSKSQDIQAEARAISKANFFRKSTLDTLAAGIVKSGTIKPTETPREQSGKPVEEARRTNLIIRMA